MPQDWESDWRAWVAEDEKQELINAEQNAETIRLEVEEVDRKLNLLLDSYLDGVVESETYKQKKNELFEKKLKLQEDLVKINTVGSSWLEPMKEYMDCAFQAQKIARAKNNPDELRSIGKRIGSNFFLLNRRLVADYRQPFATLCATPPAQSHSIGSAELSEKVPQMISQWNQLLASLKRWNSILTPRLPPAYAATTIGY